MSSANGGFGLPRVDSPRATFARRSAVTNHFLVATIAAGALHSTRAVDDALGTAGILSLSGVVLVWGWWLATRTGTWWIWRLVPLGVVPCVATPLVLAGVLSDTVLSDVAKGTLLAFAVLVSIGTLVHAARLTQPE